MSKRDDLGRGVLEDLAALRAKGSISSILPARRVDPVPNTLAQEMSAGYIQTIARLKSERESGKVVLELDPKQAGDPDLSPPPSERDDRWRVIVRRPPEIDE